MWIKKKLNIFLPCEKVDNIFSVDLKKLKNKNFKGIILDADNTLFAYNSKSLDDEVKNWIRKVKGLGFKVAILSNATLKSRKIKHLVHDLKIPVITFSFKPLPFRFKKILKLLSITPQEAVMIGDQILTDILGGNIVGLYTILVKPISKKEFLTTSIINRPLEKIILKITKN